MNLIDQINREQTKKLGKDIPDFAPGDTLRIGYKVSEGTRSRVQNYEGVVMRRGKVRRAKLYYLRERSGRSARITEKTNYKPLSKVTKDQQ